jgi:hypothetical protein
MAKFLVLGGTGSVGRLVVQRLLSNKHHVIVVTRNPEKVTIRHENLEAIKGDVYEKESIRNILVDVDFVISALGPDNVFKPKKLFSRAIVELIQLCNEKGVKSFVCITAHHNATDKANKAPWIYRKLVEPYILKRLYNDMDVFEEWVLNSSLNMQVVVVKPYQFVDGPDSYRTSTTDRIPECTYKTTRSGLATFLADEAYKYNHKKVLIDTLI